MPIEIKELYIKVTVNEPHPEAQSSSDNSQQGAGKEDGKDAIIAQCVEQVMEILNNKEER
ncbi:MAG TPA: DUF5908 family protein [Flavipsychrobacter sp.]|nr:DUF5908 family protein [Flavipsychrobacter sp.]